MSGVPPILARKQRGALIVALMAGIAIMMILSTVAVQTWSDVARRDKEAEMIFRAQDIVRALKRFQLDKGKLPTELKELTEPGQKGQYFIRRLWKDPLVKGGQWQLLYAGPAGGLFDPSAPELAPAPPTGGLGQTGLTGQTPAPPGGSTAGTFPPIGKTGDGSAETTGLPIAGVKTKCTDHPFRVYKEKSAYKEWVFSIFDLDPQAPAVHQQNQQVQQKQGGFPPAKNP